VVPAAYLLIYERRAAPNMEVLPEEAH